MSDKSQQAVPSKGSEQTVPDNPGRGYAYFRDNQITFLVSHQEDTISGDQLKEFVAEITSLLEEGRNITRPPRTFSFPAPTPDDFIQWQTQMNNRKNDPLPGQCPQPPAEPKPLMSAFSIIVCDIQKAPEGEDARELIALIRKLRGDLLGPPPRDPIAGLTVQAVTPNWLMSSASNSGGTGGPGGDPVPFRETPGQPVLYQFDELKLQLSSVGLYGEGADVDVVILDTAPCPHELALAYKVLTSHRLVQELLKPGGPLRLYPATYDELLRMENTSLNAHNYPMTDHGLFVAGIIHSIVPAATIHLIEVLNPFGVGDLATLAGGLEKAYNDIRRPGRRLVVNCSWMLELPISDKHCYAERDKDRPVRNPHYVFPRDYEFEQAVRQLVEDDECHAFVLQAMCDSLAFAGTQAIAAAGNDWDNPEGKKDVPPQAGNVLDRTDAPEARYPAAFSQTVGVGALPQGRKQNPNTHKQLASTYSNLGNEDPKTGVMTLGGEPGDEKGVLGLYLGKFPQLPLKTAGSGSSWDEETEPGPKNTNGWAWWAGTSFATPILTGAVAAVLSSPAGIGTTQRAVEALYTNGIILEDQTDAHEDALFVTQV